MAATTAKKLLIAATLLFLLVSCVIALALRDRPARAATGDARMVSTGDIRIEYFVSEARNSDPARGTVVLLASYARSVADFNELIAALNDAGYRSIAMHARGVGRSAPAGLRLGYADYAGDLKRVLDAEGIERPLAIIGHAWGNRIARSFAHRYPERSRGLILLAAGGEVPTPPEVSASISKAVFRIFPAATRSAAIQHAFFAPRNPVPQHWLDGWYPRAGLAQAAATAAAVNDGWQDGGQAPMLILQPAADAAAAAGGAALKQRLSGRVTLIDVPDAGHALLPEQPAQVAAAILQALENF